MKELSKDLLTEHLEELAAFEPNENPFISLYLNAQADQHGRDNFEPFVRKEFSNRAKTFADDSPERESFERSTGRIVRFLNEDIDSSANGLAIFARAGEKDFFKAIQTNAPINKNKLHVGESPHIYPLARLIDQNPAYVALIADTEEARIFVFDLGTVKRRDDVSSADKSLAADGVRSQMRYRRRVENQQQQHVKETIEMLDRIVSEEKIEHIILAGDEIIVPLLRERLPAHLAEKVIDVLRLDIRTPEHEVLRATIESLREDNIQTDAEKVRDLFDKSRAGELAVAGLSDTFGALSQGQVEELVLCASLAGIRKGNEKTAREINDLFPVRKSSALNEENDANEPNATAVADALVARALQTGAAITFIEDRNLLADVGGVGAFLRYRI